MREFDQFERDVRAGDVEPEAEAVVHDLGQQRYSGHQYAEWKRTTREMADWLHELVFSDRDRDVTELLPVEPNTPGATYSFQVLDGERTFRVTVTREA